MVVRQSPLVTIHDYNICQFHSYAKFNDNRPITSPVLGHICNENGPLLGWLLRKKVQIWHCKPLCNAQYSCQISARYLSRLSGKAENGPLLEWLPSKKLQIWHCKPLCTAQYSCQISARYLSRFSRNREKLMRVTHTHRQKEIVGNSQNQFMVDGILFVERGCRTVMIISR